MSREEGSRSLILLAGGAIVGLALAGWALFTAPGSTSKRIPEGAIARINTGHILLSDYLMQLEALYEIPLEKATPEQRKAVLESMIAEELLVQRGLEIELPATDAAVREAMVAGVHRSTTADIEAKKPGEAELRAWFDARRDKYRSTGLMAVRDFVAPAASAAQAVRALRGGMRPDAAAARFGLKEKAPAAGQQPDIAVARALGPEVFAAAQKLDAGQVSDPVTAADGVHILVMDSRRPSVPLEFEAARENVAGDFKRNARQRARDDYVKFLRGKVEILVAPGYGS